MLNMEKFAADFVYSNETVMKQGTVSILEQCLLSTYILFIPYFRLLVFGILFTLVVRFFFYFYFAHLALKNVNKDIVSRTFFLCWDVDMCVI